MSRQPRETREFIDRRAVLAAGLFLCATLILVTVARLTGAGTHYEPAGAPLASAELFFEDHPGGVVTVSDAATGASLMEYGENEGVFVRSVMRGIARQRRMRGLGPEVPVELSRFEDGQLWLIDPASGIEIYLGAFGSDNTGAFAELLAREEAILSANAEGDIS